MDTQRKTKRLSFPLYVTEGNVIFLSGLSRLDDKELVDWYNHLTKKFVIKYPSYFELADTYLSDNPEFTKALSQLDEAWQAIRNRKIEYEIVDGIYLKTEHKKI